MWCLSSITRQNIELFFIKNTGYLFDPLNPDQEVHADGDPELLDDSEFYQQLLKEFFETFDPNSSGNIIWHLVYTHDLCFVTWMWEYHSFQKESIWVSLDYISLARYPGYRAFIWLTGWIMRGPFFTFIVHLSEEQWRVFLHYTFLWALSILGCWDVFNPLQWVVIVECFLIASSAETAFYALQRLKTKKRKIVDRRASKSRKIR